MLAVLKIEFSLTWKKANPKVTTPAPRNLLDGYHVDEIVNQIMWNAESHGETREGVLQSILTLKFDLLILDEPEQGLSLKNQKKYLLALKDMNKTIIIITHSKVFVEQVEEVFDVEEMKWANSIEYLKTI